MPPQVDRSVPVFEFACIVKVPPDRIHCGKAEVVGREYGPDNRLFNGAYKGWVYYLVEVPSIDDKRGGMKTQFLHPLRLTVAEDVLQKWQD